MITYKKTELLSSTEIVRNFSSILDSITKHEKDKIAVMRKNKLEAIILSVEEYERIYELLELFEHIQIYKTIEQRKDTPLNDYIDLDQLLAEQGTDLDEI
ncbi:MAG: prevent-host-death protein [Desulfobacula sp.]|jgi:PHD/YefM family antitoxin component YafN of YafNO toxin-antitoxin module|nr:prevent-host-death protein [Desulfobacula sp.]MBT6340820.1 prevent-host-death protein [Desulfobacula sp.]MBT7261815.1 prevent-host-death protein [Desulfobacula sp.]